MDSSNYFLSHSSLSYHHQSPHHDCCNARPSEPNAALTSAPLLIFCPFGHIFMHTGMFTQCYYYFFFCTSLFMSYSASRNIWSRGEQASDRNYPVSVPRLLLQASECEVTSRDLRGGLNPGRTAYSLYDLGWIFSPLCALVSSFIKGG